MDCTAPCPSCPSGWSQLLINHMAEERSLLLQVWHGTSQSPAGPLWNVLPCLGTDVLGSQSSKCICFYSQVAVSGWAQSPHCLFSTPKLKFTKESTGDAQMANLGLANRRAGRGLSRAWRQGRCGGPTGEQGLQTLRLAPDRIFFSSTSGVHWQKAGSESGWAAG